MTQVLVQIGRVTNTKGARIHLAVQGRTVCGVLSGAQIIRTVRNSGIIPANLCKRCFTQEHVTEATDLVANGPWSAAVDDQLWHVRQAIRTPEQIARDQELIARSKQPATQPQPAPAKSRSWAELKADYATILTPAA